MKNNKSDHLTLNVIISGICRPVSMLLNYIYIPVVLNYLGVEKYGIWTTILTLISWVGYFDIGIGNGLRNRLTETLNGNAEYNAKKMVSSSYVFSTIIMTGLSIIFVLVAQFLDWYKIFGVLESDESLKLIVIESVLLVAFNFVFNLCINVLYAFQKASIVSLLQVIALGINLIGVFIIKRFTVSNLTLLVFVYGFAFIAVNVVASILLYSRHKELAPSIKEVDFGVGKDIIRLGFKFFVIQICALVLFATDSLIISYLYGAVNVTPYSNVNKLFMAISGIYIAFITPIWSSVTKDKANKDTIKMLRSIRNLVLLMIPFALGAITLLFVFRPLADWWLGMHLEYPQILLICGMLYCVFNMWCSLNAYVLNGLEVMTPSLIIAVIQAVVNIPLSLFFAVIMKMESAGVLLGTVISMSIAALIQPVLVIREINKLKKANLGAMNE